MKGSDKQIKWAEDIKASKAADFASLRSKVRDPKGIKAMDYVEAIDWAAFWIEYEKMSAMQIMNVLLRSGLLIKGWQFQDKATMDQATGVITVTHYDTYNQPHSTTL